MDMNNVIGFFLPTNLSELLKNRIIISVPYSMKIGKSGDFLSPVLIPVALIEKYIELKIAQNMFWVPRWCSIYGPGSYSP